MILMNYLFVACWQCLVRPEVCSYKTCPFLAVVYWNIIQSGGQCWLLPGMASQHSHRHLTLFSEQKHRVLCCRAMIHVSVWNAILLRSDFGDKYFCLLRTIVTIHVHWSLLAPNFAYLISKIRQSGHLVTHTHPAKRVNTSQAGVFEPYT